MQMRRNGLHIQSEWGPTEQVFLCRMQKNIGNIWKPMKNAVKSTARICLLKTGVRLGPKLDCGYRGREQGTGKRDNQALLLLRWILQIQIKTTKGKEKVLGDAVMRFTQSDAMHHEVLREKWWGDKRSNKKDWSPSSRLQLLLALSVIKLRATYQALLWHW